MLPTNLVALPEKSRAGKDHTTAILGLPTLSVADPIYEICNYYFGECDKNNPSNNDFFSS